jgi:hypothetical protein
MLFFSDTPTATELVGYLAGAVRDCMGFCGDVEIEADALLLWDEFGMEPGFEILRDDEDALDLAARMAACLRAISRASGDETIRELAMINAAAWDEATALLAGRSEAA